MPVSRKLLIRVIGAPLLLAALGGILWWGHRFEQRGAANDPLNFLLLLVAILVGVELRRMCAGRGIDIPMLVPALMLLFILWARGCGRGDDPLPLFAGVVVFLVLALACDFVFRGGPPERAGLTLFAFLYVAMLGFLIFPPVHRQVATVYLLFLLACSKGSDMAAFVVGKSIGRHKMAPVVSPNKTWEGGIGGGMAGTAAGFLVIWLTPLKSAYPAVPLPALLGLALLVTIAAQVGDLVKSAFKRWAGVKDSGRLLPEFGGMLDMVDSFLVSGPIAHFATVLLLRAFK